MQPTGKQRQRLEVFRHRVHRDALFLQQPGQAAVTVKREQVGGAADVLAAYEDLWACILAAADLFSEHLFMSAYLP
jgi:hypothetical protein